MLIFKSISNNPHYNLALEEVLLKRYNDDFFLLYRNNPSVIIGKHQIPYCEIDYRFILENNILLARRLSGGGTVYHDLENLNFSFILNTEEGKQINFRKYTGPILEFLNNLGVEAYFNDRNDILLNDKKISGNAEHIFKDRVLHHGTLLYNSEKDNLSKALTGNKEKYKSKAIESVRSKVCNIKEEAKLKVDIDEFETLLFKHIANQDQNIKKFILSEEDNVQIEELINNKYSTNKWNFEYSPKYQFKTIYSTENGSIQIEFETENIIIRNVVVGSDFLKIPSINILEQILADKLHHPKVLMPLLDKFCSNYEIDHQAFLWSLF